MCHSVAVLPGAARSYSTPPMLVVFAANSVQALLPDAFVIRPLQQRDLLPTSKLLLRAFEPAQPYNPVQRALIVGENLLSLRERAAGDNLLLVGTASDEIVGFVEAYLGGAGAQTLPERLRSGSGPYVASLAVDPSFRGRGLGSALMQECEARIGDRGAVSVALEVEEGDEVLSFYQKLGYAVTKRDGAARKLEGDIFFGRSVACPRLRSEKILDT